MDPLTALGAASSAAQLLQQGTQIAKFLYDLNLKMKDASKTMKKQSRQVEQLSLFLELFLRNDSLQKDSVALALDNCLRRCQELQLYLEDLTPDKVKGRLRKFRKAFKSVAQEHDTAVLFNSLEREKTSLMLCIQEIDTSLLRNIDINVSDIKTTLGNLAPVVNDTAHNMTTVTKIIPGISTQVTEIHTVVTQLSSNLELKIHLSNPNDHYLVPSRRIRDFIGREDVLTRIQTGFSLGATPRIVVVRGLGGQGKTQIALRYCYQAQSNGIRAIFWVDAMSENSVMKSFTSISNSIKRPGQVLHDSPESRARFVLERLRTWLEPWLVVFDNHDDPSAFSIRDFIPEAREHGFVLVTSRHADTDDLAESENAIELQGLPEKDALSLLFKQSRATTSESSLQHGRMIVERLGYHALAIRQAGSYISLQKIELHQFMDRYQEQRSRVQILNQTPQVSEYRRTLAGGSSDAKETALSVFTTWELTFQQLQAMDTAERHREHIMTLFAFFHCKDISEELFQATCKEGASTTEYTRSFFGSSMDVSGHWVHENFVGTLIELTRLSLVQSWSQDESDVCHLTLHPLIKDWIRLRTDIITCRNHSILAARILANLLENSMDSSKYFQLSLSSRQTILLHLDTYYENLAVIGMDTNPRTLPLEYGDFENSEYWFHAFLSQNGQKGKAAEIGRRLVTWHEQMFGPDHNNTIISSHNLARSLADVGKNKEAEEIHTRVLKFRERKLGPEHPDTLSSSHELAHVLQEQGKYKDAGDILLRIIPTSKRVLGLDHPETLTQESNFASNLACQGKYKEAENLNRRILRIRERTLGLEHPSTLKSLNNIARNIARQGKYTEAEVLDRRVILTQETVLGTEHPSTLKSLQNLARSVAGQGKYKEAEEIDRHVLLIREKVLGVEHPYTLLSLSSLSCDLGHQANFIEAEEIGRRVFSCSQKVLGPEHPEAIRTMNNLACFLRNLGEYDKAEILFQRAIQAREHVFGLEHPETLQSIWELSVLFEVQGRYLEALDLYERACSGFENVLGDDHPDTRQCFKGYSDILAKIKSNTS